MKSHKISPILALLVVASLLAAAPAHADAAQRTRRRTRHATPRSTPQSQKTTTATPQSQKSATVTTPQTPATRADSQVTAAQQRPSAPERSLEELLPADAYGVYAELRSPGVLAQTEEIKTVAGALALLGDETKPLTDLIGFVRDNSEELTQARVVMAFMATRPELPPALLALEMPTSESAAAFEPKLRRMLGEQLKEFKETLGPPQASAARPRPAQRSVREKPGQNADAASFSLRRTGRLILAADSPFTLRRLRADEGATTLADSVRFQSARTRFSSDSLFLYVDTTLAQQGWAVQTQKAEEARVAAEAAQANRRTRVGKVEEGQTQTPIIIATTAPPAPAEASPTPTPEETPTPDAETGEAREVNAVVLTPAEEAAAKEEAAKEAAAAKSSEEEMAVWQMSALLGSVWGGIPRVPGAFALGVGLEAGAIKVRLAVENSPDGTINVIPFLPNVVAGPPVAGDAASVAPDDSDIFFTTSVDWTQIYTNAMGTAATNLSLMNVSLEGESKDETETPLKPAKMPTADEAVATVEKLFRFKFKEDLLPALGNEVSISMPFDIINGGFNRPRPGTKREEKESAPGFVVIISLNNPDKVREILPRVLTALNFVSPGATFAPPEQREGFEIRSAGDTAYTIINNFLVAAGDVRALRHVIDSYASRQTLANASAYRDTTVWQTRQKLAQIYLSETPMRQIAVETKRRSGASEDPLVRALLAQLEVPPEPASYEVTNEGDVLIHELHLPVQMIKTYAATLMIAVKDAPVTSGEAMAVYALSRIEYAEEAFKKDKKKERYGTLEELYAEELLEKDFLQHLEYKIELNATTDKFEATATPKNYGKTGRRSFYVDQTGQTRAADHKGKPASSDDPPVD